MQTTHPAGLAFRVLLCLFGALNYFSTEPKPEYQHQQFVEKRKLEEKRKAGDPDTADLTDF